MVSQTLRKIRESFSAKIIMLVVTSVLLTSFVVGLVTTRTTIRFLIDRASEKFPSTLTNTHSKIRYWYTRHGRDLEALCKSRAFRDRLDRYHARTARGKDAVTERDALTQYVGLVQEDYPVYQDILLMDSKGGVVVATSTRSVEKATLVAQLIQESVGTGPFSQALFDPEKLQVQQWMFVPIAFQDGDSAWLAVCIGLEHLGALLADVPVGPGGDIYLLNGQGRFLTQSRQLSESSLWRYAMSVPTRQDGSAIVEDRRNHVGRRVLLSKVHVVEHGWWLVYEDDYQLAMSPVISARRQIWVAVLLIGVLAIFVALRVTRSVLFPIHNLALGARRINEGLVGVKIPRTTNDEIGLLTDTFNEMAKTITLSKAELQYKNKMLNSQNDQLQEMNVLLEQLSITDGLTGLFNHRHFWNILDKELARVDRYQGDLALILVDLDDFKRVNDQYGHSVGDLLLQSIAGILRETVRDTDVLARYGGEEFAVLLPETDRSGVESVAEKLRASVEAMRFEVPDAGVTLSVTVSVGISVFRGDRREFFNSADKALYTSKEAGKNQVNFAVA